jgi:hypothetical protein
MAVIQQQQGTHWKDRAIAKSEAITDAWEVTKVYAGRLAEWVLFGCMIANIIEILPGVSLWPFVSNFVLGTQSITLDVAGFGLASMADHARANGDEQAAGRAELTGWFLIGLMILTLLLVSVGLLWPTMLPYTGPAEKGLILARVVMTVVYGHVIHGLRRSGHTVQTQQQATITPAPALDYQELARHIAPLLPKTPEPQLDHKAIAAQIAPLFEATIVREIKAIATVAGPAPAPQIEAKATSQKATSKATTKRQPEATQDSEATDNRSQDERLEATYQTMLTEGAKVSGRALAQRAHVSRDYTSPWLKARTGGQNDERDTDEHDAIIVDFTEDSRPVAKMASA